MPEKQFFKTFAEMKAEADKHWIDLWGKKKAGPFNTECLATAGDHSRPTGRDCTKDGQPLPPVPSSFS